MTSPFPFSDDVAHIKDSNVAMQAALDTTLMKYGHED